MYLYLLIAAGIVLTDQAVKFLIVQNIALYGRKEVFSRLFSLTHTHNTGGAWSILEGSMLFFYVITVISVICCLFFLKKYTRKSKGMSIAIALILAGAVGNFIDRMRLGYVVDMFQLDFINFPIFNVADMSLVIGAALVTLMIFREERGV